MDVYILKGDETVLDVLQASGMVSSRSEGRRLVDQNGVKLEGEVLTDPNSEFPGEGVLQVGKRRFLRIAK